MSDYKVFKNETGKDHLYHSADGTPMIVNHTDDVLLCKKCGLGADDHEWTDG